MDNKLFNEWGIAEMYEWANVPERMLQYAYFVQFSKERPGFIEMYSDKSNAPVGITTVHAAVVADNPQTYPLQYYKNEFGDTYVQEEEYAVGLRKYDQLNEFSFVSTEKRTRQVPINTDIYNSDLDYIPRDSRNEWVKVNYTGKVIVRDDGEAQSGDYCTPYIGDDVTKHGTAVKATDDSKYKYYVIARVSDNTILIVNKQY